MRLKRRRRNIEIKRRKKLERLKRLQKGSGVWDNFKKSWNSVFF